MGSAARAVAEEAVVDDIDWFSGTSWKVWPAGVRKERGRVTVCLCVEDDSRRRAEPIEGPSVADFEGGRGGPRRPACLSSSFPGMGESSGGLMPRYGSA